MRNLFYNSFPKTFMENDLQVFKDHGAIEQNTLVCYKDI